MDIRGIYCGRVAGRPRKAQDTYTCRTRASPAKTEPSAEQQLVGPRSGSRQSACEGAFAFEEVGGESCGLWICWGKCIFFPALQANPMPVSANSAPASTRTRFIHHPSAPNILLREPSLSDLPNVNPGSSRGFAELIMLCAISLQVVLPRAAVPQSHIC